MGFVRELLARTAPWATVEIAKRWGGDLGMWFGCGYPKSGTVWMCQLMAGYLDIPLPRHPLLPVAMEAVVHGHWRYDRRLPRCFYIHRDGRDVMVSYYFHQLALEAPGRSRAVRRRRERLERAFGSRFQPDDVSGNLAKFIELEMTDPWAGVTWPAHIAEWCAPGLANVALLSYEEMLTHPVPQLTKAFQRFLQGPVDEARLQAVVDRYAFPRQAGRARGDEDRSAFHRKGVAGDWRNHFTREAAEVFEHYAGSTLRRLGYTTSPSWMEACP